MLFDNNSHVAFLWRRVQICPISVSNLVWKRLPSRSSLGVNGLFLSSILIRLAFLASVSPASEGWDLVECSCTESEAIWQSICPQIVLFWFLGLNLLLSTPLRNSCVHRTLGPEETQTYTKKIQCFPFWWIFPTGGKQAYQQVSPACNETYWQIGTQCGKGD